MAWVLFLLKFKLLSAITHSRVGFFLEVRGRTTAWACALACCLGASHHPSSLPQLAQLTGCMTRTIANCHFAYRTTHHTPILLLSPNIFSLLNLCSKKKSNFKFHDIEGSWLSSLSIVPRASILKNRKICRTCTHLVTQQSGKQRGTQEAPNSQSRNNQTLALDCRMEIIRGNLNIDRGRGILLYHSLCLCLHTAVSRSWQ